MWNVIASGISSLVTGISRSLMIASLSMAISTYGIKEKWDNIKELMDHNINKYGYFIGGMKFFIIANILGFISLCSLFTVDLEPFIGIETFVNASASFFLMSSIFVPVALLTYGMVRRATAPQNGEIPKGEEKFLHKTVDFLSNALLIALEAYTLKGLFGVASKSIFAKIMRSYFIANAADSLVEFCKAVKEYFWKPVEIKNLDYVTAPAESADTEKETQLQEESWLDPSFLAKAAAFVALYALLPGSNTTNWVSKVTQSVLGTGVER